MLYRLYRVSQKIFYNPGNSALLFRSLVFFPGCLTKRIICAARIVLFISTIDWQVDAQYSIIKQIDPPSINHKLRKPNNDKQLLKCCLV